jgi:tetratricopeptide (TPR) repeat protein
LTLAICYNTKAFIKKRRQPRLALGQENEKMKTLIKGLIAMFLTINAAGAERIGTEQEYLQKEIERWSEAIKETNQDDGIYIAVEQYYKYRADAYQKLGDYENALKDYTRALKLRSNFPEAHHARAACLSLAWYCQKGS